MILDPRPATFRRVLAALGGSGVAFLVSATVVACSGNSSNPPEAFVDVTLIPGGNGAQCNTSSTTHALTIGSRPTSASLPTTVKDGDSGVSVRCTVAQSGGGFTIDLNGIPPTGRLAMTSTTPPLTKDSGSNIRFVFSGSDGSWSEDDCSITYTYGGVPINPPGGGGQAPIAPGRIWGHVSCPLMTLAGQTVRIGSMNFPVMCDGEADFLFQHCSG